MKNTLKRINKIILAVLAFAFIVNSCTLEKRHYLSGYYIHNKNEKSLHSHETITSECLQNKLIKNKDADNYNTVNSTNDFAEKFSYCEKTIISDNNVKENIDFLASIDNKEIYIPTARQTMVNYETSELLDSCDNIILKNGDEISAKVLEIGIDELIFKKCDNLNGPTIRIKKADVFMIKYPNGTKTIFSADTDNSINQKKYENKSNFGNGFSIASLIFGLAGLLVLAIVCGPIAVVFGIIGLSRGKLEGLATMGILIGFIDIIAFFIIISKL